MSSYFYNVRHVTKWSNFGRFKMRSLLSGTLKYQYLFRIIWLSLDLSFSGFGTTLEMFTYSNSSINEIIFECMGETSLTGVSGRVVFTSGADPNRVVKVERIQGYIYYTSETRVHCPQCCMHSNTIWLLVTKLTFHRFFVAKERQLTVLKCYFS